MAAPVYSSSSDWYCKGRQASYLRARKSPGGVLDMIEVARPAGDMSRPGVPDLVLYQDLLGGSRVRGDLGAGKFDLVGTRGVFCLAPPNFATTAVMDERHQLRSLSFPMAHWVSVLEEAAEGRFSVDTSFIYGRMFDSPALRSAFRSLWSLGDEDGVPSRLLARAAGCEILAELCRLAGSPLASPRGGLAPWAERRCLEFMRERLSEEIGLDEMAAEARLSPYHFARMFKRSFGVPPRVYLTRMRVEKACALLKQTERPITQIALEVGYSSSQVLARVFIKHMGVSPSAYRRATRDRARLSFSVP